MSNELKFYFLPDFSICYCINCIFLLYSHKKYEV
nr:MAG TPA: hypothetical protein [Caudoviricetes sp.]DAY62729.1 MAG TPA: hypothetical protein [Caudoviricetes sp.]